MYADLNPENNSSPEADAGQPAGVETPPAEEKRIAPDMEAPLVAVPFNDHRPLYAVLTIISIPLCILLKYNSASSGFFLPFVYCIGMLSMQQRLRAHKVFSLYRESLELTLPMLRHVRIPYSQISEITTNERSATIVMRNDGQFAGKKFTMNYLNIPNYMRSEAIGVFTKVMGEMGLLK